MFGFEENFQGFGIVNQGQFFFLKETFKKGLMVNVEKLKLSPCFLCYSILAMR